MSHSSIGITTRGASLSLNTLAKAVRPSSSPHLSSLFLSSTTYSSRVSSIVFSCCSLVLFFVFLIVKSVICLTPLSPDPEDDLKSYSEERVEMAKCKLECFNPVWILHREIDSGVHAKKPYGPHLKVTLSSSTPIPFSFCLLCPLLFSLTILKSSSSSDSRSVRLGRVAPNISKPPPHPLPHLPPLPLHPLHYKSARAWRSKSTFLLRSPRTPTSSLALGLAGRRGCKKEDGQVRRENGHSLASLNDRLSIELLSLFSRLQPL